MKTHHLLLLAAICLTFVATDTKAQRIVTGNTNISLPLDPFFDGEEFEKDYPEIVCLKYHLKEEKLPELITEVALKNIPCPFTGCIVSLADIVEATQLPRFSTEVLAEALGKIKLGPNDDYNILLIYRITPVVIEDLLRNFGLTFSEIYNNFVKSLSTPGQTIPAILNILNVSVIDFMNAQAYGNDTLRLQVLSTGNYSQANLNAVLNITNKTRLDMLKLLPLNTIAGQLKTVDQQALTNFVKNLGVTSEKLAGFYQYLNITPINFLSYPRFIQIITGFYDILNPEEVLGTIVSQEKVITSNKAKVLLLYQDANTQLLRNFANFHVELVENPLIQYVVYNVTLSITGYRSDDIAIIKIKPPVQTAVPGIFENYNQSAPLNCTYVSKLPFGELYSENVSVRFQWNDHTVVVAKTNATVYNLGSPLFCQSKLFGMATEDKSKEIKFSTFMKGLTVTTTQKPGIGGHVTSPTGGTGTKPGSAATSIAYSHLNIILALAALKLTVQLF